MKFMKNQRNNMRVVKGIPFDDNGEEVFLTLKHYKEPLLEVKKGYGYYGALLGTIDGTKVQCHICGKLFEGLNMHVTQSHKMTTHDYREKFQLAKKTALISESRRYKLKENTIKWLKSLTLEEKEEWRQNAIERFASWRKENERRPQPKQSLETYNKRGTCPTQLIEKIKEVAKKIGHTPTKREFIAETDSSRYVHLIYKVYGSWLKAIELANLKTTPHKAYGNRIYKDEVLLNSLEDYILENDQRPTQTDFYRNLLPARANYNRHFGGLDNAIAKLNLGKFTVESRKNKKYITV